jgi:hypothetical protein
MTDTVGGVNQVGSPVLARFLRTTCRLARIAGASVRHAEVPAVLFGDGLGLSRSEGDLEDLLHR